MSLLEVTAGGVWLWLASVLVWMLYTGLPAAIEVLRRPTPIARLEPGEVEIEGVIEAEQPVLDARGRPCAMVAVSYHGGHWERDASQDTYLSDEREGLLVGGGLSVRDRTGVCRLLAPSALLEVSAPPLATALSRIETERLLVRSPAHRAIVTPEERVRLLEQSIQVGHRVMVSGQAFEDAEASPDGYREGAGRAFVIRPSAERKLLVSAGRRSALVVRASLPLALAAAMAGACAWLAWRAWSIRHGVG